MLGPSRNCTECGALIHSGAMLGLCSACALRAAMDVGTGADGFNEARANVVCGDYELFEEIGRGGMGVVFRARQKSLNRVVALKVLSGGIFADPAGKKRLLQEAAAAARLRHPHIVAVHEAGELDGHPFYSMDYIPGRTLADVVRMAPVPPRRAAGWLRTMATAIQYAHSQQVVHRDLKPSNVLLDAADEPRITDFGLAKVLDSAEAATLSGSIFGSPSYMPPEQATGKVRETGIAGDVYSLGAILYELITGRPPFQGASPQSVIEQVKTTEPVAPRRLNPGIPIDLETITLKCLEKDPARRYASAQELADELDRFLAGIPIRSRPVSAGEKVWRWSRRHPLSTTLTIILLVMLVAVVAVVVVSSRRVRASRDEAQMRLAESLVSEAHALRLAGEPGWREASLHKLAEAHRLVKNDSLTFQLRNEAIAALSRPDLARQFATNCPPVTSEMRVCFDPAFERLAWWNSTNATVDISRVADGKLLARCRTPEPDEIHAFSADGKFLLLRHGGRMSVWNSSSGELVISGESSESHRKFDGGEFSPDGRLFGRGETNGQFVIYDLSVLPPAQKAHWPLPDRLVCATVAWSADAKSVALTLGDRVLAVCDATSGNIRWKHRYVEMVWNVTWSNARDWIVVQSGDDRVLILRPEDGSEVDHLNIPANGTPIAQMSPDGNFLVASGERFGTQMFDPTTRRRLVADSAPAWHLQFDAAGTRVGTQLDQERPLWLEWLPPVVQTTWHSPGQLDQTETITFSADGRRLASLIGGGVVVWDVATAKVEAEIDLPGIRSAQFAPDGRHLFCITGDSLFAVDMSWQVEGHEFIPHRVLTAHNLKSLAVASNGTLAMAEFERSSLVVLSGTNRSEIRVPIQPLTVAFSPDGGSLACGSYFANDIYLCELKRPASSPVRLAAAGTSAAFSVDGKKLFTFGRDVRAWSVGNWQAAPSPVIKASGAESIIGATSRDGRWLAVTQDGEEVALVELATGRVVANLNGPGEGSILALAFSPDGNTLVIARDRGDLQFWPLLKLRAELGKVGLDW